MTSTVSYPSEQFPDYPHVSISMPEDWAAITASAVLLAIGAEPKEGEFRPNVVVTATRFPTGFSVAAATELIVNKFAELPDLTEIGREEREVFGNPGFRYEASYADSRVGALFQIVHLAVIERGPVSDMLQVTATCTGDQALTLIPDLRKIVDSAALS